MEHDNLMTVWPEKIPKPIRYDFDTREEAERALSDLVAALSVRAHNVQRHTAEIAMGGFGNITGVPDACAADLSLTKDGRGVIAYPLNPMSATLIYSVFEKTGSNTPKPEDLRP